MLKIVREIFNELSKSERDPRGRKRLISRPDCLMSALAMFSLKSPSLLGFDEGLSETNMRHNLSSLFGIQEAPSDTYMLFLCVLNRSLNKMALRRMIARFAFLMMAAFAIDQIQEAACGLFQAALKWRKTRKAVWERMKSYFSLFIVNSWEDLFRAIGCDYHGPVLFRNTS